VEPTSEEQEFWQNSANKDNNIVITVTHGEEVVRNNSIF
jgi:hypothetical protein